jgi:PRTRC genetic system protein A
MPKELKSGITYCLCSNGIFEVRTLPGDGFVSTKIDGIKGLPEGKEEIRFLKKKVPIKLFWEIVRFFKAVNRKLAAKVEAYIVIAYNNNTDEYFLWVPKHEVSAASVKYDLEQFYKLPEHIGCYIVADFHLHPGEMGAFWSGTDDKDDCRDRFSGVIGKLNYILNPDVKIRFAAGKKHFELTLEDLFVEESCDYTYDTALGLSMISQRDTSNINYCSVENANRGYVPMGGRSLLDMVKERKSKNFTISELMGKDW